MLIYTILIEDERDIVAFEDIYHHYRRQMYKVAMSVLHNPEDTEDALQIAFLGLARRIKDVPLDTPAATKAYVLTAAKNAALSLLRKQRRQPDTIHFDDLLGTYQDSVLEKIILHEDYNALLKVVSGMSEIYRELLMLRHVHGLSINEIVAVTGRNTNTVRVQLRRAKQELIKRCVEEGIVDHVCS